MSPWTPWVTLTGVTDPHEPLDWTTRSTPLGPPAAPVAGPGGYQPAYGPPPPRSRRKSRTGLIIGLSVAIVLLVAGFGAVFYVLTRPPAATGGSTSVPVISNIPRPNAACTPAGDRKLTTDADLNSTLFFGYIDGAQTEMLVSKALMLAINGHKVEYVWYCPLRSQWH